VPTFGSPGNKLVIVYVAPTKTFQTVRSIEDLKDVLTKGDPASVEQVVNELRLDPLQARAVG